MQNLWRELNHYLHIETKCPEDAVILKNFIEEDKKYDFLSGLHVDFDQLRVHIIGKKELPLLNETIALIHA